MNERAEGMDRMKLGLVIEGGGMKCAYTSGIMDLMMDDGSRPDPAVEGQVSAGVDSGESIGQVSEAGREEPAEEQEIEGHGDEGDGEDNQDDGWRDLPETAEVIAPAQFSGHYASDTVSRDG